MTWFIEYVFINGVSFKVFQILSNNYENPFPYSTYQVLDNSFQFSNENSALYQITPYTWNVSQFL